VKAVADTELVVFKAILRLVNSMAAGMLPHLDTFLGSHLIAVEKSGGYWEAWPIAGGDV
jgi:hypothetical protein